MILGSQSLVLLVIRDGELYQMEYAFGDERVDCMARNKSAVFVIIIAECVNNKPQHLFNCRLLVRVMTVVCFTLVSRGF